MQNTRLVKRCGICGTELTSHGSNTQICRACFRVQSRNCRTCGKQLPLYGKATLQCRECWKNRGRQPVRVCISCGKPMNRYTNPLLDRCKECRAPQPKVCVDCGKLLTRHSQSPRCWDCHTERRQVVASQKVCTIEGCTNKHMAKGLCAIHYERMRVTKSRGGKHIDSVSRIWVAQQPCQLCGYARMRSHVHRVIAQGDYVLGNMIALCARCHDEVHRGLTPCPEPLGVTQLVPSALS